MSVGGHKSMQSLALYQRVVDDEKLMMGVKLTFYLHKQDEAIKLKDINDLENMDTENDEGPSPKIMKAIKPAPGNMMPNVKNQNAAGPIAPVSNVPLHALDPANKNILPLESALVPRQPSHQKENVNTNEPEIDFDLMELIADVPQIEKQYHEENMVQTSKKALMTKKQNPTFAGCTFGSTGTLNIHIYKN